MNEYMVDVYDDSVWDITFPKDYIENDGQLYLSTCLADAMEIPHTKLCDMITQNIHRDFYQKHVSASIVDGIPQYIVTRSGAMMILMEYDGYVSQPEVKVSIINKFNSMSESIRTGKTSRDSTNHGTGLLRVAILMGFDFSNEANMINKIVLGKTAKQIREIIGIRAGDSIRPYLSSLQIQWIEELQAMNTTLLKLKLPYDDRKARLKGYFMDLNPLALDPWQYTPCLSSEHDEEPEEE
jgi:phage regulator Rha-like protein